MSEIGFEYLESTNGIEVLVVPTLVPEKTNFKDCYFYSYDVKIRNTSSDSLQLLSRRWIITDGNGQSEEICGDGVVGEQPRLGPGETFQYTSHCPLPTPTGNMRGAYILLNEAGETFEVRIPLFFLRDDKVLH